MKIKFLIRTREIFAAYTENNMKDCVQKIPSLWALNLAAHVETIFPSEV